ncbi:MAG: hypothetical protein AAB652_00840 [Patescibacteria group bacterium]|mgnify:CR=1
MTGPKDDDSCDKGDSTQTVGEYVSNPASAFDGLFSGGSSSDDSECEEDE